MASPHLFHDGSIAPLLLQVLQLLCLPLRLLLQLAPGGCLQDLALLLFQLPPLLREGCNGVRMSLARVGQAMEYYVTCRQAMWCTHPVLLRPLPQPLLLLRGFCYLLLRLLQRHLQV